MLRTIPFGITHGTATLRIEAFGGLKHELGDEAFAEWIDHVFAVCTAATAAKFSTELPEMVKKIRPNPGRSDYAKTTEVNCDGTTVKITIELRLKVELTGQQRATLANKLLALYDEELSHHLDDKPRPVDNGLGDMFGVVPGAPLDGFDLAGLLNDPAVLAAMLGGNPFTALRMGMLDDTGYQVDGLGSASAMRFPFLG